jgi:hypothetical protein
MWLRVVLLRTDVSEEHVAFNFRVERTSDLRTTLATTRQTDVVPSSLILSALKMEARHSSELSVLKITTQHHIPEEIIIQIVNLD